LKVSKKRAALLRQLESIIGRSCYNANIQNWGPGGVFEGEGRSFRYSITFTTTDGTKRKGSHWYDSLSPDEQMSGRYAFGANELMIVRALDDVVSYMEANFNLKI
jgi:hypothetical protein